MIVCQLNLSYFRQYSSGNGAIIDRHSGGNVILGRSETTTPESLLDSG